eukprot:scaffold37491_cov36-Phaeocystis_antarctica.AAC.1
MALVDERRKTLSARLDNTRFRVELEATKHAHTASTELAPCTELAPSTEQEAAKAWKHAWEEAETEYAEKETKLANQLETDRLKLEHDLAEVTKSKEEEFEELIREEVERREVRARAPTLPILPPPNLAPPYVHLCKCRPLSAPCSDGAARDEGRAVSPLRPVGG